MKPILPLLTLLLAVVGCKDVKQAETSLPVADSPSRIETPPVAVEKPALTGDTIFPYLAGYPKIKDTLAFINKLREVGRLDIYDAQPVELHKITVFKKIKLYGSDKDFYLVEYDWQGGPMSTYPWHTQIVFSADGRFMKAINGKRFDLVTVFPKQNPFLLTTIVTSRGNGGHRLYKASADSLENVYEGYYNYDLRTVDHHEDTAVFEPSELRLSFKDENKDGFNDMVFSGQKLLLYATESDGLKYDSRMVNGESKPYTPDDPASKVPVKYIFLYDKASGHFKAKEKYPEY